MHNVWKKVERYLGANNPDVLESLNPPADASAIAAAEAEIGFEFPETMRASLSFHDGMREKLYDLWRLLPVSEILDDWRGLVHLMEAGEFEENGTEHDNKVGEGWFRRGWIPFAGDDFGNLVCVDMDPGRRGKVGQVVIFWHDDDERKAVSSSLLSWMRTVARELPKEELESYKSVGIEFDGKEHAFRNPKAAQICAMKGHTDLAVLALEAFLEQGDIPCAGSLAAIHAFRGNWDKVFELSPIVIRHRMEIGQGNLQSDQRSLIIRAGAMTGRWDKVREILESLRGIEMDNVLDLLLQCAEQKKDLWHSNRFSREPSEPPEVYDERYANYREKGPPSTYSSSEPLRRMHHVMMAIAYRQWDVLRRLIDENHFVSFSQVLDLAVIFEPEETWDMIIARLHHWREPYYAQVAPVCLLTTPSVRGLMTKERCETILSLPKAIQYWDYRQKHYD